jgi:hypothetical protein
MWREKMFITLRWQGNVQHIVMWKNVCHNVMIGRCTTYFNECLCSSHWDVTIHIMKTWLCSPHCDVRLCSSHCNVTMFGRLRDYYVWHISMFGNVFHIQKIEICASHCNIRKCSWHCNDKAMCDTFRRLFMFDKLTHVRHMTTLVFVRHVMKMMFWWSF